MHNIDQHIEKSSLIKHRYPAIVIMVGFIFFGLLLPIIYRLPYTLEYVSLIEAAQTAYKKGDLILAKKNYLQVLNIFPNSRIAQVGLAKAIFSDKQFGNKQDGVKIIMNIKKFSKDDWAIISAALPSDMQSLRVSSTIKVGRKFDISSGIFYLIRTIMGMK